MQTEWFVTYTLWFVIPKKCEPLERTQRVTARVFAASPLLFFADSIAVNGMHETLRAKSVRPTLLTQCLAVGDIGAQE